MKKFKVAFLVFISSVSLVGCLANEGAHNGKIGDMDNSTDNSPIAYNTKQEEADRLQANQVRYGRESEDYDRLLDGYLTNLEKPETQNSTYQNGFYNEEVEKVTNAVNNISEVKISQVLSTKDKVFVSVMLEQVDYSVNPETIKEKIYRTATRVVPDKEIIVWTDEIYWNKLKDIQSRVNNDEDPEEIPDFEHSPNE